MAKDRKPTDPSDWVVQESSMPSIPAAKVPGVENVRPRFHSVSANLLAPEGDSQTIPEAMGARGARPANLDVSFNWRSTGPAHFDRPIGDVSETPEQWEIQQNDVAQGLLFRRPSQEPATIEWMRSTKADRGRIGTGLGILQNEADKRGLGELSEGAKPDLSKHSSHLVGKLTGREHNIHNDITHYDTTDDPDEDDDRALLDMPRQGEGGEFSTPTDNWGADSHTKILSRGEANMGLSRFRVALANTPEGQARTERKAARKRASEPTYTQGGLFDDTPGPAASTYQLRSDLYNKNHELYGARMQDPYTGQ